MDKEKKLYRVNDGKMVAGVCGGIAEYFQIDPPIIRIAWVFLSLFGGCGVLAYIIALIIMPVKPQQ